MLCSYSTIEIKNSTFKENTGSIGGAIRAIESNIVLSGCSFIRNKVLSTGGAIFARRSSVTLKGTPRNIFALNSCPYGAALACDDNTTITLTAYNVFTSNYADYFGGALYLGEASVTISGIALFSENIAQEGGAISSYNVDFQYLDDTLEEVESQEGKSTKQLYFIRNSATGRGGAMLVTTDNPLIEKKMIISGRFINNTAGVCGGAMHFTTERNIVANNVTIAGSEGSAVCLIDSSITFTGVTRILYNTGKFGGGIYSERSSIMFKDTNVLEGNHAFVGGAIYLVYGTLLLGKFTLLLQNRADTDGGALYAVGTDITFQETVQFNYNSAGNGGAMYFQQTASINFATSFTLIAAYNHAHDYGGVIFNEDVATPVQCSFIAGNSTSILLPHCFLRLKTDDVLYKNRFRIYISNNSAGRDGAFLYGGLLDRCQVNGVSGYLPYEWLIRRFFRRRKEITTEITSQPYQLCFCESDWDYNCLEGQRAHIYKGQKLQVSLLALDQTQDLVSTTIKVLKSSNARIKSSQNPQIIPNECSTLTYNLYSAESHEQLILYPDGPCQDTELARAIIDVTLWPCPDAFTESGDHCVCEERLQEYASCIIDDDIYIIKNSDSKFWMSVFYDENGTYQGLIFYNTCPKEYCTTDESKLTLDSLNTQCNLNRSGVLCGACSINYSLMLGSNRCQVCSNAYLALLIPFAAAGVAMVAFLSLLRLTIANGMLNSVILYANIIQVNRNIFLPISNARNVLTVFIAWLNLDLGFQACFYDGMDAYAQTWLQFAFPLYVWILMSLIIFTSRYSITVSKLIGHNPIAVLATLLLMSYTKVLKIVIEVYSSVVLDYPGNKTVRVWLKDANVPYLESWHLLLTVVTTLVLVFLFIPYTLLLLLGYRLYRFSGMNRLKPLLDSYYAPYKIHTRYWTGFLLLTRCALYIVFSYNSLGGTTKSLLAILVTFTAIFVIAWISVKIYKSFFTNLIEASVYINLMTLSGFTLAEANSPALVYSLIGVVFATTIAIILHHFHLLYIAKSGTWLKMKVKMTGFLETVRSSSRKKEPVSVPLGNPVTQLPREPPTKSVVDLREPLLEN